MLLSRIHDHLLVLIVSALCLESLQQDCSKFNNTDGYAEHIADNSKKCSANTFGSQDTERCHSIYWAPNGYNQYWDSQCFDVVTIYYNGEGPCCEGYDSKSIYPKNGDNKKGPYQGNHGLHRYFYVDICRKRTQIYILYVIYNQDWKIQLDSLVPVTLKASDLNETPCLSKCHEAISKENLEKVSGPCLEDGCYEYELRWKETILDMPEYHRCFTTIDFYYGNNVECSNGEDCVSKGYRKVSRNPRESIDGLKSGDICGLADKAYAEFVTIKHDKSHEETRRSWVAMDLSAKITPCKDQCYDLDNPELPTTAFYSEGKIRGWSVQCTPNHHNNCYEKHGLTSYYFISLEDPENYKNWAKTKANNRFYWNKKKGSYLQMVNPWRCFDKMTLFYNGDSITNKDAFDLQYAKRSYYTNWLGDYRSLSGYKLVDDDPTWKTFTIYPRLTGKANFQVPGKFLLFFSPQLNNYYFRRCLWRVQSSLHQERK